MRLYDKLIAEARAERKAFARKHAIPLVRVCMHPTGYLYDAYNPRVNTA